MNLSGTLAARAKGESVAIVTLILIDFEGAPYRAWTGAGTLVVGGDTYNGLGDFVSVSALPLGSGDSSGQATFTLSGVNDDFVALARSEVNKVQGRSVTVWKQFLAAPHTPLDDPIFIGTWIMMAPRFSFTGPSGRSISVAARSIFDDRQQKEEMYYSDRYQQAQYPGDKFFEFISQITPGLKIDWPDYN